MPLDVHTAQNEKQVMEAVEKYIYKCFQGSTYWFDQGNYSLEKTSPLDLKFKFDFIRPLIDLLDLPYAFATRHTGGYLKLSGIPLENKIHIKYENEHIHFKLRKYGGNLKLFFSPLMISLGFYLEYLNTIIEESSLPLANENNKVYFFGLSPELRAEVETKSLKNRTLCERNLKEYKEERRKRSDVISYLNKVEQIHESFLLLPATQVVFCSFYLSGFEPEFKWLVLDPALVLYPSHFFNKIELDSSRFDIDYMDLDDMVIFGWIFQMHFKF